RPLARAANLLAAPDSEYKPVRFNHVPVDAFLRALATAATESNLRRYEAVARYIGFLLNPARVTADDFRWLLSQGGEHEPRLLGLRAGGDAAAASIELLGDRPLSFTTLKLSAPPRVVVDFADTEVMPEARELAVEDGTVRRVAAAAAGQRTARVVIELAAEA